MKIVIIGGHLTPALAVVSELKNHEILYVGRKYALEGDKGLSLEYRTITSANIKFASIATGRLQRKFTIHTIPSLFKLPIGLFQSFSIMKKFKPNVVVGFGGYVSVPLIFSAFILRIPIVIHEQTLKAGLANKISSIFASKICISWESSRNSFPKSKTVLTGNPVRGELKNLNNRSSQNIIYITGGSLGSHFINTIIEQNLKKLLKDFKIIHQTGEAQEYKDYERLSYIKNSLAPELRQRYELKKFLNTIEVSNAFSKASLVISRAGINTITELIYFNKPCILIPLPQGAEQKQNASFLENAGLAEVFNQDNFDYSKFLFIIKNMVKNKNKYRVEKDLLIKDAAKKIKEVILDVGKT